MTSSQKVCQWFEILLILVTHTSITRCFHPDKNAWNYRVSGILNFWNLVKSPNDLLVKQIVDFHCNQVDAIKWIRFTCFNVTQCENWTIFRIVAKWYFGNNHSFTFKITFPSAAIISRRLMILTKCDSMLFLLLIVYFLLILSHLWEKWGNFKYFSRNCT